MFRKWLVAALASTFLTLGFLGCEDGTTTTPKPDKPKVKTGEVKPSTPKPAEPKPATPKPADTGKPAEPKAGGGEK